MLAARLLANVYETTGDESPFLEVVDNRDFISVELDAASLTTPLVGVVVAVAAFWWEALLIRGT